MSLTYNFSQLFFLFILVFSLAFFVLHGRRKIERANGEELMQQSAIFTVVPSLGQFPGHFQL